MTAPSPSACPSCGRFVGPYARCPYCGADVSQRLAIRVFKAGSLVLALGGVAVLLLAAVRSEVPAVEIGRLVATMNWAYVRVEGVASRQPAYDPEAGALRLWVWDGTGEILVMAYRAEAEALLAEGRVPTMGDRVRLEGTLRVREDFQYLVLNVPQHFEVEAAAAAELPIDEMTAELRYEVVTVQGQIRDDRTPYEGLRILTLRDASGEIDVLLPTEPLPDLRLGQSLRATGAVDLYEGRPQISVGRAADLAVLDEPLAIAPSRRTGDLSTGDLGRLVQVEGTVAEADVFSAGLKLRLDDGSGGVTVLLWQDLWAALPDAEALVAGATLRVWGEVDEYGGDLEVVPQIPPDVMLLAAADRTAARRRLGDLSAADLGRLVRVEGLLRSLRSTTAGVRGTLDDGTGTATLWLWQEVYEGLPDRAALAPGAVLHVEGEVAEYKGELEVVPLAPAAITVTGAVALPLPAPALGQIRAEDVGQLVQVAGQIVAVTPFASGTRCTLDDGTGTITLLLWQDLYERLADPAALVAGAQVSVWGEVDEYGGELEIVPQVPEAVVLQAPAVQTPEEVALATPTSTAVPTSTEVLTATQAPTATPEATAQPTAQATRPPTPTPTPAVEVRTIGAIGVEDVGRRLAIAEAGIAGIDYFSRGVQYTLTDPTGSIVLLVWQNVLEGLADRYDLFPGSRVRVAGEIDQYEGLLEIVPRDGVDVAVLARGDRAPVEERTVTAITPSDEGRIFIVEGAVTRVEGEPWRRVWLADGTGEILVYVPQRAVPYLPAGIGPGVKLRVTGEVDIYQGTLEVIPLAGADVEVR